MYKGIKAFPSHCICYFFCQLTGKRTEWKVNPKECLSHAAEPVKWWTLGQPVKLFELEILFVQIFFYGLTGKKIVLNLCVELIV